MAPTAPRESLERSDVDFDSLAGLLSPLGNATRLKLLHLSTKPRYLEEIATELGMSRQGARKHLDGLVEIGVLTKQIGRRDFGPVTEYILNRPRLFQLHTEFAKLGTLRARGAAPMSERTVDASASPAPRGIARIGSEPCLTIVRGLEEAQSFPLADSADGIWRIGRDDSSEVVLDFDPFLSQRHAEVRRKGAGFVVVDAFSRNGTYVNWERIEKGAEAALEPGDVIGVGKTLLVFQLR